MSNKFLKIAKNILAKFQYSMHLLKAKSFRRILKLLR